MWSSSSSRRRHGVVYSKLHPFCCINVFRCVCPVLHFSLSFRSLCTYLGSFRALSCNTFAAFSWPSFSFFFAFLSFPFLSSLVAAGAGKTLIFQFVAEFLVIFLLPQFGARSVAVVFPSRFVPLPSSSLLCSCLLCVLVCLVLLLSHLCSAINFT